MKVTFLELSNVLGLTKDRIKQIGAEVSPDGDGVDKSSHPWTVQPSFINKVYKHRGIELPSGKVVVCGSQKGGIGKTTTTINVAGYLGALGFKVLVIDADPEGHASNTLIDDPSTRITKPNLMSAFGEKSIKEVILKSKFTGVDLIQSSVTLSTFERRLTNKYPDPKLIISNKIEELKKDYNIIFIDVSPSYSFLSISSYMAANQIIIPATPDVFALESVQLTIDTIAEIADKDFGNIEIRVLANGIAENQKSSIEAMAYLTGKYPKLMIPTSIKASVDVRNANNEGKLVFSTKNKELKDSFRDLAIFVGGIPRKDARRDKVNEQFSNGASL